MVEATRQSLFERFQLLRDSELLASFRSGELTDLAKGVACEELQRRGIDASERKIEPLSDDQEALAEEALVPVARLLTAAEAEMLKARLEVEGVPAIMADAETAQTLGLMALAVGGVRVLVPESCIERALEIVDRVENGYYTLRDEAEPT
jgi:hypothetical protein